MQNLLKKRTLLLILAVIAVLVTGSGLALRTIRVTIRNVGTIKTLGVGVYEDINCADALPSIDWGTIKPGSDKNETVYIRNESNVEASLYLETTSWDPPGASHYITLSWDYSNQTVNPNEVIQVTFTLSVSSNITETGITDFDFYIVIGIMA